MRLVAPPTHVGEDQWPVLSAVRVSTADDPAEFIVLVDCGEGTPEHPYATLRAVVWTRRRTRRKVTDGEYNLTFDAARRSLAERAGLLPTTASTIEVVVVRDPDFGTDYAMFVDGVRRPEGRTDGVRVVAHDIDLGAVEITPASVEQRLLRADALSPAAARHARDAVLAYVDEIGCGDGRADDAADDGQAVGGTGAARPEAREGAA
ncbi:hypothetical protein [Virgisporangium aurantiacum]|uniref:Uncharacterized protein n=1 Tax=Virgisporangium aurantiacum TaxID=175570 RepID=A0A8J4E596_9ACTN|nr:hypothetical protein [Virgisporangium aurantiacum]GIJ62051.1 hypothetical protein Vau01_095670 [Virgisporangium aurantiacum]